MANVNVLLSKRLERRDQQNSKMAEMAKKSASGKLTSFSGIFSPTELSQNETAFIKNLLEEFSSDKPHNENDFKQLLFITSEVKAIHNQAAILHGERINKVHEILTKYKDGAFTTWLIAAYGNRQTPYNFLQYYLFHQSLPTELRPQLELMPRQAVYTLATREGDQQKKQEIVVNYKGETKTQLLTMIRERFPLSVTDKRRQNFGEVLLQHLVKVSTALREHKGQVQKGQKKAILRTLDEIRELLTVTS